MDVEFVAEGLKLGVGAGGGLARGNHNAGGHVGVELALLVEALDEADEFSVDVGVVALKSFLYGGVEVRVENSFRDIGLV